MKTLPLTETVPGVTIVETTTTEQRRVVEVRHTAEQGHSNAPKVEQGYPVAQPPEQAYATTPPPVQYYQATTPPPVQYYPATTPPPVQYCPAVLVANDPGCNVYWILFFLGIFLFCPLLCCGALGINSALPNERLAGKANLIALCAITLILVILIAVD